MFSIGCQVVFTSCVPGGNSMAIDLLAKEGLAADQVLYIDLIVIERHFDALKAGLCSLEDLSCKISDSSFVSQIGESKDSQYPVANAYFDEEFKGFSEILLSSS